MVCSWSVRLANHTSIPDGSPPAHIQLHLSSPSEAHNQVRLYTVPIAIMAVDEGKYVCMHIFLYSRILWVVPIYSLNSVSQPELRL